MKNLKKCFKTGSFFDASNQRHKGLNKSIVNEILSMEKTYNIFFLDFQQQMTYGISYGLYTQWNTTQSLKMYTEYN